MNDNDKRGLSLSSSDLSPSISHIHKKQNTGGIDLTNTGFIQGQNFLSNSLQSKIASIVQGSSAMSGIMGGAGTGPVPPFSSASTFTSTPKSVSPSYASKMANTNNDPNVSHSPSNPANATDMLSENDIIRIALTVKNLISSEIQSVTANLVNCIDTLAEENKHLKQQIDELEMYSRRSCIRVFGVDEGKTDTDAAIMDIASKADVRLDRKDLLSPIVLENQGMVNLEPLLHAYPITITPLFAKNAKITPTRKFPRLQ